MGRKGVNSKLGYPVPPPRNPVRRCSSRRTLSDKDQCVSLTFSKVMFTISKMTAGALFPSIAICILSKCYATRYLLHHSWIALIVSFEPAHNLHTCEYRHYVLFLFLFCFHGRFYSEGFSAAIVLFFVAHVVYDTHPCEGKTRRRSPFFLHFFHALNRVRLLILAQVCMHIRRSSVVA